MGGLARRASFIKALEVQSNDQGPVIFLDSGNLFSDDRYVNAQLPAEIVSKNRWVTKAYGDFGQEAANITYNDLPFLAWLMKKDGFDKRTEEFPFTKRLISANIHPTDAGLGAPEPYIIKEVSLKRGDPGGKLKIGIVGLTDMKPDGTSAIGQIAGYQIEDPMQAAKRVLPEVKKKADYVIVLAYLPQEKLQALASQNPEIDTIIGGKQNTSMGDPSHFNKATVTLAYTQTKYVGELRIFVDQDGKVTKQVNRYVALTDAIPDDPMAADEVASAHNDFTAAQTKAAQDAAASQPPLALLGAAQQQSSPYVGAEACSQCHLPQYDIWKTTGHSHAMASLEKRSQQNDPSCIKCHVVGYQQGGFQGISTPQFANVQCESCHGPGRQHTQNPGKGYGFMATPVGCVQCHTQSNSPDFNFATYLPKIKHWDKMAVARTDDKAPK
jgi:hypothetical protein